MPTILYNVTDVAVGYVYNSRFLYDSEYLERKQLFWHVHLHKQLDEPFSPPHVKIYYTLLLL